MGAPHEHLPPDGQAFRRARTGGAGGFVVHLHLLADGVKPGVGVDIPGVAQPGGAGDSGVAVGGHPHRRVRLLHRTQHQPGVPQPEILPVVVDPFARPQQPHRFQAFQVAADPRAARRSEVVVLLIPVAQGGGEDKIAAGDDIHRRHAFRQVNGMVQRRQQRCHQPHPPRFGGDARQQRHRLQLLVRVGEVMLALIDQVKAQVAGRADISADVGESLLHIGAGRLLGNGGKGNSEFHW